MEENEYILSLWQMVADQRDFNGALRIEAVISLLHAYNGSIQDLEKIMAFERAYREEKLKDKEKDGN